MVPHNLTSMSSSSEQQQQQQQQQQRRLRRDGDLNNDSSLAGSSRPFADFSLPPSSRPASSTKPAAGTRQTSASKPTLKAKARPQSPAQASQPHSQSPSSDDPRMLMLARCRQLQRERISELASLKVRATSLALFEAENALVASTSAPDVETARAASRRGLERVSAARRATSEQLSNDEHEEEDNGKKTANTSLWTQRVQVIIASLGRALTSVEANVRHSAPASDAVHRALALVSSANTALAELVATAPPPPPRAALRVERAGAEALAAAHFVEDFDDDDFEEDSAQASAGVNQAARELAETLARAMVDGAGTLSRRDIEKAARNAMKPLARRELVLRKQARALSADFACVRAIQQP